MPFDHLLDDATSAADAAEAAQIMAQATVTDDAATAQERADAQSILDLAFDELVTLFSASQSGGRHEATGRDTSQPVGSIALTNAIAEASQSWQASVGGVFEKQVEAVNAARIYIRSDGIKGLRFAQGNFTIAPADAGDLESDADSSTETPDASSNIYVVQADRRG